jgi:hypothetical protein
MAKRKKRSGSTTIGVPIPSNERESVNVRRIKNGYLIETSGMKGRKYVSEVEYSPGKPVISASVPKESVATGSRAAAKHKGPLPLREVGFLNRSR